MPACNGRHLLLVFILACWPWQMQGQTPDALRLSVYIEENVELQKQQKAAYNKELTAQIVQAVADYERLLAQTPPETVQPFLSLPSGYLQQLAKATRYFRELPADVRDSMPPAAHVNDLLRRYPPVVIGKQDADTLAGVYASEGIAGIDSTVSGWSNAGLYSGMQEYLRSRLASLPFSQLSSSQQLEYEKNREQGVLLSNTGDTGLLRNFLLAHPLTDKLLWQTLGDLYAAQGQWDSAIGVWKRMQLLGFPGSRQEHLAVVARIAHASRVSGDQMLFEDLRRSYQSEQTPVMWKGEKVSPAQLFKQLAQLPSALPGEHGWPQWKGNNARSAALPAFDFSKKFVKLKTIDFPRYPEVIYHPVAWQNRLYYQLPGKVMCVDVETGKTVWHFPLPSWTPPGGVRPDNKIVTCAIVDGLLYCVSSPGVVRNIPTDGTLNLGNFVYCLDARSGAHVWHWPDQEDGFDNVIFNGPPVVADNRLYVGAAVIKGQINIEVFCLAARAELGDVQSRLLWRRFVCSYLPTPDEKSTMEIGTTGLTACYGLVYCVSNLGVVAALDMYGGETRWLAKYHQHFTHKYRLRGPRDMSSRNLGWHYLPPIAKHGRLYVVPSDAKSLFVYDAFSGALHKIFPESQENDDWNQLIGVGEDGKIFLCGPSRVAALQDNLYQEKVWNVAIPNREAIQGTGVWAGSHVYLPTTRGIFQISAADGKIHKVVGIDVKMFQPGSISPVSLLVVPYAGKKYLAVSAKSSLTIYKN